MGGGTLPGGELFLCVEGHIHPLNEEFCHRKALCQRGCSSYYNKTFWKSNHVFIYNFLYLSLSGTCIKERNLLSFNTSAQWCSNRTNKSVNSRNVKWYRSFNFQGENWIHASTHHTFVTFKLHNTVFCLQYLIQLLLSWHRIYFMFWKYKLSTTTINLFYWHLQYFPQIHYFKVSFTLKTSEI